MEKRRGIFFAAIAGISWGITGVVGQFLFGDKGILPEWLVAYRLLISGVIMLTYQLIQRKDIFKVWKDTKNRERLLIYSVFGMMAVQLSFFVAVRYSNAGTATVLQYLNPMMMMIYFAVSRRIMPRKNEFLMVGLAIAGIFLIATKGNLHELALSPLGLIWGLGCAVSTCLYSILPIKLLKQFDVLTICGWGMLLGGIVLSICVRPWTIHVAVDGQVIGCMVFLILFGTILPFCCSLRAMPMIGPVYANLISSVEPIVAAVLAFAVLGTKFTIPELIGFGLIIGTIFLFAFDNQ